jgi:hypothetical protein
MAAATGSDTLAVVSRGIVHLLHLSDGTESWSAEVAPHAKRVEGPIIAGGALYVMADGAMLRFEGAAAEVGLLAQRTSRR